MNLSFWGQKLNYGQQSRVARCHSQTVSGSQRSSVEESQQPATVTLTTLTALEKDIPNAWKYGAGQLDPDLFSPDLKFTDPLAQLSGWGLYRATIEVLRLLLRDLKYTQHKIWQSAPHQITTKWTIQGRVAVLSWGPEVTISGRSRYTIDATGKISEHVETWDSVDDQSPLSLDALRELVQQVTRTQLTPELESPSYEVLMKAAEYEIRRYNPFVVAQVAQSASSVTSGRGFNTLADYIFGKNEGETRMEMTTPVITTSGGQMQFPMEISRGSDPERLPPPKDASVERTKEPGGVVGALQFSGWPLDGEVAEAEAKLRTALLAAGHKPKAGYSLLRYNEPYVPPFLRRNEVVIALEEYDDSM